MNHGRSHTKRKQKNNQDIFISIYKKKEHHRNTVKTSWNITKLSLKHRLQNRSKAVKLSLTNRCNVSVLLLKKSLGTAIISLESRCTIVEISTKSRRSIAEISVYNDLRTVTISFSDS